MLDAEVLKSFTKAQLGLLLYVYDECKLQGADSKMLAPLAAVIWTLLSGLTGTTSRPKPIYRG